MAFERKTTHVEEALAQLAEQFHDKPNVEGLLRDLLAGEQELEHVFWDLIDLRALDVAQGPQLDGIGDIVGERRQGRDDSSYRTAIRGRIVLNKSSGTTENIISIIRAIVGPLEVEVTDTYPAHFDAVVNDPITPDPPAWLPSTAYNVGDKVSNFGNAYTATVAGTSAASPGPSGTGSVIVDGTVTWTYASPGIGARMATIVLSGKPAAVRGIIAWFESGTPFAFFDSPDGAGFDVGEFAQAHDF